MSSISSVSSQINLALANHGSLSSAVGITMLKKAMEVDGQNALQLLQSVAPTPAPGTNNPPHLGHNVDTRV